MANYIVTMYYSIETETEEEAREIAFTLDILPKRKEDKQKIYWDAQNAEVEEALF